MKALTLPYKRKLRNNNAMLTLSLDVICDVIYGLWHIWLIYYILLHFAQFFGDTAYMITINYKPAHV